MRLPRDPIRRRRLLALGTVAVVAVAVGLVLGAGDEKTPGEDRPSSTSQSPAHRVPLRQAIGQTLVMSFDGTSAPGYIRRRLREGATDQEGGEIRNAPFAGPVAGR